MKPIVRWTCGIHNPDSYFSLNLSIESFYKIYKDNFDYYVCYNNCNPDLITKNVKVKLLNQENYVDSLPCPPAYTSWKLYPPSINDNTHEIFIDNDLVIYNHMPMLDVLLQKNIPIITEGYHRRFGKYDDKIQENIKLNSGFIGIPPKFNFRDKIIKVLHGDLWEGWFDEQGVVAAILSNHEDFQIIPLDFINICFENFCFGKYGIHFIGINNNTNNFWKRFFKKFKLL